MASLRAALNKARVLFVTQFADMAAYRAEVIIWMLSGTLSIVMMLVWMSQAASAPGGQIQGYAPAEFASYFIATWLVSQLMVVWVAWELDVDIRTGTLSPKLLRPLDPMWVQFMGHVSERLIRIVPMLVIVALMAWASGARFSPDPLMWLVGLGLAALGFCCRFLWEYTIGLLAFWTESSTSFQELMWLFYAALGGMFAPLAFYPEWVQAVAVWTPFPYMLGLPAQLLAGKATLAQAGQGALVLLVWLAVLWAVRLTVWRVGLRRYGAVGA